jgi:hypothetical protein
MSVMGLGVDSAYAAQADYHKAVNKAHMELWRANTPNIEIEIPLERQVGGEHYRGMVIQPIEYIMKNGLGWCEGNAIKYISRYKQKGQKEDIKKAIHYLEILLDELGG